jgi:nucleoside-diphosphate-sugar epimerase
MEPTVGILGLGYLGSTLARLVPWSPQSWGTCRPSSYPAILTEQPLPVLPFDWTHTSSWEVLPVQSATLILTIPPIRDLEANRNHLQQWSAWMREHRPACSRLLYVSTTGIYPKQAGVWTEDTREEPDSLSGELRKQTEDLLGEAFDLQVVRPGGIYGPKRNLWQRLRNGQAMPTSPHQPTHRIHVEDLARLIHLLILQPELPSCINAVDHQPLPSLRVAQWCAKQRPAVLSPENHELLAEPEAAVSFLERRISNQRLQSTGLLLRYPTYQEGYHSLLDEPLNQLRA